jgi:hypothetical protein
VTKAHSRTETLRGVDFHRIISDGDRLRMLTCLHHAGELKADELARVMPQPPADTRQMLGDLAARGLLAARHQHPDIHYRLADDLPVWVTIALGAANDWNGTSRAGLHAGQPR